MCGISGSVTNAPLTQGLIEKIHQLQHHRGPDGMGEAEYITPNSQIITLLHQRLAIIDLEYGVQPMEDVEESLSIIFNGEIFNHAELRESLLNKGHKFKTDHSDTEVLLQAYKEYGVSMLNMLNGMFAFAIYDKAKQFLFLARDRTGIKPLYYTLRDGEFFLSSELKTLLFGYGVERKIDKQSLVNYLSYQFIPAPNTIIQDVYKLEAAHYLIYDIATSKIAIEKYWDISFNGDNYKEESVFKKVFNQVRRSVELWSKSDVGLSLSLSSGIDSSILAALIPKNSSTNHKNKTFSLGFKQKSLLIDETDIAKMTAKRIESDHHECLISSDDFIRDLDKMIYHLDEPYAGGLPSWFVYKLMHGKTKVALTGTGGDELFGNYRKFLIYESNIFRKVFFIIKKCNKSFLSCIKNALLYPNSIFYHKFFNFSEIKRVIKGYENIDSPDSILENKIVHSNTKDPRNFIPYVDFKMQLPEEFLHMTDRFSMAFSIEARTPLLDHNLIELVMNIPSKYRTDPSDPKRILKKVFFNFLSKDVLNSPKKGFVVPKSQWIRADLKGLVNDVFNAEFIKEQGIFNDKIYERYIKPHMTGKYDNSEKIWTLLMFQLWYKKFILESAEVISE